MLRGVLGALAALHDKQLAHGSVKLENVIVARGEGGAPKPVLIDVGGDRLLGAMSAWHGTSCVRTVPAGRASRAAISRALRPSFRWSASTLA